MFPNETKALRIVGVTVWLVGLLVYCILVFFVLLDLPRIDTNSTKNAITFFIRDAALLPGLVPLVAAFPLLTRQQTGREFGIAVFVVIPLLIVLHYVVAATIAHSELITYCVSQTVELAIAGFFVWCHHTRRWIFAS